MSPSATTGPPWPEGRPPHMIQTDPSHSMNGNLDNIIRNHIVACEECAAWAGEHSDDLSLWIYPSG